MEGRHRHRWVPLTGRDRGRASKPKLQGEKQGFQLQGAREQEVPEDPPPLLMETTQVAPCRGAGLASPKCRFGRWITLS